MAGAVTSVLAISALAIEYNPYRLIARLDGNLLRVAAPNFSFLSGKQLERLKDGASVAFLAQVTVSTSPNYLIADSRSVARFAISYDIWEERFSVAKITDRTEEKRTVKDLPGPATETWCLDNLPINEAALPANAPFYVQLDLRVEDPRDQPNVISPAGISLARMVEIFSRPVYDKQAHWLLNSGPLRLDDLRKGKRE